MSDDDFDRLFHGNDDLPAELLRRCYDLRIRLVKFDSGDISGTFKLEGNLALERAGDHDDLPHEVDIALLHQLLARFEKSTAQD